MQQNPKENAGRLQVTAVYALTIFLGAFLLFQSQPLIGKYILPWYGGAPGVWTTCLLFFQVLLLGGYAYAHLISHRLAPRSQVICHLILLAIALALLPIIPNDRWKPAPGESPTIQILLTLAVSLGLPYFVLSSTGPLMQQWFSRSRGGATPYRLYALSNIGSLLALITFPVYFETHFTRQFQAGLWGWGLVVYALACGGCAVNFWRTGNNANKGSAEIAGNGSRSTPGKPGSMVSLLWLLLPACASVMLLATTNKICQEVAVIPFLWVLPLSLYLLSFIICFDSPRWYLRALFIPALIISWGTCELFFAGSAAPIQTQLIVYSAGLFVCCMVCHGELYRLRPDPRHLTAFYLMIAAGGALGGLFVAIIAPLIFNDFFELQTGALLSGGLLLIVCLRDCDRPGTKTWRYAAVVIVSLALAALGILTSEQIHRLGQSSAERSRNFYGVLTVFKKVMDTTGERFLRLNHGRTTHGIQLVDPQRALWPTTYYSENSGVGAALQSLPAGHRKIGLVGLGVGTLATYAQPGDVLRIYEINPDVPRLAYSRFTYLTNCQGKVEIILGDARLSLERETPQNFDLIVLDAFSSDAVPVHLLTREAFLSYERHLKTNGILAVHVSNVSLDLEPVIANVARDLNYRIRAVEHVPPTNQFWNGHSIWMLLSRDDAVLDSPVIRKAARPAQSIVTGVRLWTDDFASLFQVLRPPSNPASAEFQDTQSKIAYQKSEQGDFPGAIATLRAALAAQPEAPDLLNNLAWLLTTCPDVSQRNTTEAVQLAERACRLTRNQITPLIDTLAAAYAEAGQFDNAILTAEKTCAFAEQSNNSNLLEQSRAALAHYRSLADASKKEPATTLSHP